MDFDVRPYNFTSATTSWLILLAILAALGLVLPLASLAGRGGAAGLVDFRRGLISYLEDLFSLSFRRIAALASLTLKEAVRRKALLVFVMFAVLLMFAGWFITDSAGLGVVVAILLVVMGVIGQFWLSRRIPENARSALQCRVPLFGELYFISSEGQPQETGLNVGDVWAYRSHIPGNSRARAVYVFRGVDESALTRNDKGEEELLLECRFEAFRTVKGSESSIVKGISAQYTLSVNPREEAFGMLAQSEATRAIADALREGQYNTASAELKKLTERIRTAPGELRPADYFGLHFGMFVSGTVLDNRKDPALGNLGKLFIEAALTGEGVTAALQQQERGEKVEIPYEAFAAKLDLVADGLTERSAVLMETLQRMEVPLPSFNVSEYHDLDESSTNLTRVPRRLRFVADYETLGRFLAAEIARKNDAGGLLADGGLKASLTEELVKESKISQLNAERLVAVLGEQLTAGTLAVDAGKLKVADGRSWYLFFDDLIRREQLVSEDTEGWMIEKDLLQDLIQDQNGDRYLRVEVACINDQMYLGMARPDLFIRKADQPFWVGYWKAILSILLMLLLIIVLGVTVSCVVKGPVALLFTLTFFIVGQFFHDFMIRKLAGVEKGTGTVESMILIAQHRNPEVGMDVSEATLNVVRAADQGLDGVLRGFSMIVPDFAVFNRASMYVGEPV